MRRRRPRCLKGERHRWILGSALVVASTGQLMSSDGRGGHLRGRCRKCGKRRMFHPYRAKRLAAAA